MTLLVKNIVKNDFTSYTRTEGIFGKEDVFCVFTMVALIYLLCYVLCKHLSFWKALYK